MAKLPKFTLEFNEKKEKWVLANGAGQSVKSFGTKKAATASGVLQKAVGRQGGSVRIKKADGKFQEERTFPASTGPRKSAR